MTGCSTDIIVLTVMLCCALVFGTAAALSILWIGFETSRYEIAYWKRRDLENNK